MASVLRVAEVNQCQHKMLLLLSPSLLQRLLINPTFCCELNHVGSPCIVCQIYGI